MKNCLGISWGTDAPVNLMRSSIGWLAVHYDDPESEPIIAQVFNPKNVVEYSSMMKRLTWFNYNTDIICPLVEIEMSWIS